jgi:type II secretory pathway component PulC
VLKGVFVGADASRSRALIAQGDEDARLYKPDDKLPDGAVLRAVGNKAVEIEKNGEMRTLPLERGRPGAVAAESPPPAEPAAEPSAAADAGTPAAAEATPP